MRPAYRPPLRRDPGAGKNNRGVVSDASNHALRPLGVAYLCVFLISLALQFGHDAHEEVGSVEARGDPEWLVDDVQVVDAGRIPCSFMRPAEGAPLRRGDRYQTVVRPFIVEEDRPGDQEVPVARVDRHRLDLRRPALIVDAGLVGGVRIKGVGHIAADQVVAVLQAVRVLVAEDEGVHEIQGRADERLGHVGDNA